jgi:hypothetical protein
MIVPTLGKLLAEVKEIIYFCLGRGYPAAYFA